MENEQTPITPDLRSFVIGGMGALMGAVRALVASHPNVPLLARVYEQEMERQMSMLLASRVGDEGIAAFQEIRQAIDPARLLSAPHTQQEPPPRA